MIYLARKYRLKPRPWGPWPAVRNAILGRLADIGIDQQKVADVLPLWEGVGNVTTRGINHDLTFYKLSGAGALWRGHQGLDSFIDAYDSMYVAGSGTGKFNITDKLSVFAMGYFTENSGGYPTIVAKRSSSYNQYNFRVYEGNLSFYGATTLITGPSVQANSDFAWGVAVNSAGRTCFYSSGDFVDAGAGMTMTARTSNLFTVGNVSSAASMTANFGYHSSGGRAANRLGLVIVSNETWTEAQFNALHAFGYGLLAPQAQRIIFDMGRATSSYVDLASTLSMSASMAADMTRYAGINATLQALTGASAGMAVARAMSTSIAAATSILASLSTDASSYVDLIASIASTAGASAALSVTRGMAAQIAAASDIVAGLARTAGMSTQLTAAADIDAALDRQPGLSTSLGGATTASGTLDRQPGMETSMAAASSISGALAVLRGMQTSMDAITRILAHFILGTVVSEEEVILGAPLQRQVEMLSALQTEVERLSALTRQLTMYVQLTE